ncbi:MAG: response regulator transcription factor [Saprospiraceae bacterium]|nr:response regulator transcription factor [Saprospiraceae bacterium]
MTCIIVEDQPPAQRILKKYIEDIGSLELKGTFSDAIKAMDFLKTENVDLIFLDIHLPKISGMDFLKSLHHPPHIILTTAFPDYALESYEFSVVDYLLKPFSFQRFVKAISKIPIASPPVNTPENTNSLPKTIFIKSGYEHIRINTEDIIFIQSDADYTELITQEKKYLSSEPLRHWEATLPTEQFFRIHKSYLIHTNKIQKVAGNQVYLEGENVLPIGRTYKEVFTNRFLR